MPQQTPFPLFSDFVKSLAKKPAAKILKALKEKSATDTEAETMRHYLETYYKDATAIHSYMDVDGMIWDCMPIDQQPGLHGAGKVKILPSPEYPGDAAITADTVPLRTGPEKDDYGNDMKCPDGYVPVKRLTLGRLSQFKTLKEFTQKSARSASFLTANSVEELMEADVPRKYAYVRQVAPIRGGGCILSIWRPVVDPRMGQVQSISQIWVAGGSGDQSQTVEVGWEVSPAHWGTPNPVLFIYYTPDNYKTGSYNQAGGAFVLKNPNIHLGGTINSISVIDGDQYDVKAEWFLLNNAWWLYINRQMVGYYPQRLFGTGPLSGGAGSFLAGGEVSSNGTWGPMGSGLFAQGGFRKAAYIKNATLMANDGSLHNMDMTPFITAPNCYKLSRGADPAWGSSIFYGGPGGNNC